MLAITHNDPDKFLLGIKMSVYVLKGIEETYLAHCKRTRVRDYVTSLWKVGDCSYHTRCLLDMHPIIGLEGRGVRYRQKPKKDAMGGPAHQR